MYTISDHAWENGFRAAVIELQCKSSVMLDGVPRMSTARTESFNPVRPELLSHDPMFFDDWDGGYERAILLWRLGIDTEYLQKALNIRAPLAHRSGMPGFDGMIRFVIDGELRIEPRIWQNRKGQYLPVRHGYQKALDMVYHDYAEKYQQVRAAQLLLVEKECSYCAKSVDECICREITK